jgi:hypothetical protein
MFWIGADGQVLLVRRPDKGLLGGMMALPTGDWREGAGEGMPPLAGRWQAMGVVRHIFTHFALELAVETLVLPARPDAAMLASTVGDGQWWRVEEIDQAGLPTLFARAATLVVATGAAEKERGMSEAIDRSGAAPIAFAGGPLDRVDQIRIDPERLAETWADPRARIIVLDGLDPVPAESGMLETVSVFEDARLVDHALLGLRPDGSPLFVSLLPYPASEQAPTFPPRVWQLAALLQAEELAIYGGARSLADWHHRHQFCAKCGQPTAPIKAGWARRCGACAAEHFPRTDPVVIMLAEYEGKVLVGRNGRFRRGAFPHSPVSSNRAKPSRRRCGASCSRRRAFASAGSTIS